MFNRDAKQAEVLMSQQEHLLSKDETPTNLEQAEALLKRHEALLTTMDANDDKVNGVLQSAELLVQEEHFAADKIAKKVGFGYLGILSPVPNPFRFVLTIPIVCS